MPGLSGEQKTTEVLRTTEGHAGKPFTLARTMSPGLNSGVVAGGVLDILEEVGSELYQLS